MSRVKKRQSYNSHLVLRFHPNSMLSHDLLPQPQQHEMATWPGTSQCPLAWVSVREMK